MHALQVADRYAAAIEAGDDEATQEFYAPEARIWHNTDGKEQTVEENLALGQWLRRRVPDVTFTELRNIATETGFVRLCVMRGTGPSGNRFELPSCIVGFVRPDGLIERIEEYIDPAPLTAALRK